MGMPAEQDVVFARIAIELKYCGAEQVESCLAIQASSDRPMSLGHHLVQEGHLTEIQHSAVLEKQRRDLRRVDPVQSSPKGDLLFGRLIVREGFATEEEVAAALREQAQTGDRRSLGEVLIARGVLETRQVEWILGQQSKWVMRCPRCDVSLTVHSTSRNPRKAACPRCGVALEPGPAKSESTEGEYDTSSTLRPPPPSGSGGQACRICDHPFLSEPGPDGRVECLSCRVRFQE
jgi:hypothetical protein